MSSILSNLLTYLPQHDGLLPKWLLFISVVSFGNSVQAYLTTKFSSQVYLGPAPSASSPKSTPSASLSPATPLSSRTFGTWTVVQSIVRLYAAYYISNPQIYQMAYLTYVVAWLHFVSEWLVFGTARLGRGLAGPLVVANATLVWMWLQWGYYVQ